MAKSQSWLGGNRLIAYFAIALFVVFAAFFMSGRRPAGNDSEKLSGKEREDFLAGGLRTCIERQRSFGENKELPAALIEKYCDCYVQGLADALTMGELKRFLETRQSGAVKLRSDEVSKICVSRIQ